MPARSQHWRSIDYTTTESFVQNDVPGTESCSANLFKKHILARMKVKFTLQQLRKLFKLLGGIC